MTGSPAASASGSTNELKAAKQTEGKQARAEAVGQLKEQALAELIPDPDGRGRPDAAAFGKAWHDLEERVVRDLILAGTRVRRPRQQDAPRRSSARSTSAAGARLGPVPTRRDAGPGHRHARHRPRRAARRRAVRGILEAVHARLQLPVVLGRRSAADSRTRPARDRPRHAGRAERQPGAARPRRVPLHDPRDLRHPRIERLELDGQRLCARRSA